MRAEMARRLPLQDAQLAALAALLVFGAGARRGLGGEGEAVAVGAGRGEGGICAEVGDAGAHAEGGCPGDEPAAIDGA